MKKTICNTYLIALLTIIIIIPANGQKPVNPDASPEAIQLLEYIYSISGKQTLTGQHSVPLLGSLRLNMAYRMAGHYPVLK